MKCEKIMCHMKKDSWAISLLVGAPNTPATEGASSRFL